MYHLYARFPLKGLVRRHYRSHDNIPYRVDDEGEREFLPAFTHPSCWPAAEKMTWDRVNALTDFKEAAVSIDSADATPSELSAWKNKDHMEEIGALTPREYRAKKELQILRRWHWWWEAQQGAVVDHVEHGTPGGFEINGTQSLILIFSLPSFRSSNESSSTQRQGFEVR